MLFYGLIKFICCPFHYPKMTLGIIPEQLYMLRRLTIKIWSTMSGLQPLDGKKEIVFIQMFAVLIQEPYRRLDIIEKTALYQCMLTAQHKSSVAYVYFEDLFLLIYKLFFLLNFTL